MILRAVTVRPTWGAQEHVSAGTGWWRSTTTWSFTASSAKACAMSRCTATTWLALIGWQPGASSGRTRSLDRLANRTAVPAPALIANNSRFVILTPDPGAQLGLAGAGSLRRLSQDIQAVHGYPVFLAETFVDVSRFVGTCYRASNWRSLH